jgi:predicted permease
MEEELRFHLAMRAKDNIRGGMSPAEAAGDARRKFGNVNLIKDAWRDVSGGGFLEVLCHDLRFASRMLLKERGFALVTILVLAVGIGANSALFGLVNNVLLRPLPYPEPGELMSVVLRESGKDGALLPFSYPDLADLSSQNRWLDGLGGYSSISYVVAPPQREPIYTEGAQVTPELLRLLGVEPVLGRLFTAAEDRPGNRSVLISFKLWQEKFGGNVHVVGRKIVLGSYEYTIIGVMPDTFQLPIGAASDIWTTFARDREPLPSGAPGFASHRDSHYLHVIGRLRPEVSWKEAERGLDGIIQHLGKDYPDALRNKTSCIVTPWLARITASVRPALMILMGAAGCVLAITCANIANLLLARATSRSNEIAVRIALGAGRARIVRQLFTESLLVGLIGGCLGLVLAISGIWWLRLMLPPDFPRLGEISPDLPMLAFAAVISVVASCVFGITPAWAATRTNVGPALNDCSRVATEDAGGRRVRNGLVLFELVLAFVLLSGALCLLQSLQRLQAIPLGFSADQVVTADVAMPGYSSADGPRRIASFYDDLLTYVRQSGDVISASAASSLPLMPAVLDNFEVAGRPLPPTQLPRAHANLIATDYFQTMQIPLLKGRDFNAGDKRDTAGVVIVDETFARTIFPDEDAVGKRISPSLSDERATRQEKEITGVVGNAKGSDLGPVPMIYHPITQCAAENMTLVLRGNGPVASIMDAARDAVHHIDKTVSLYRTRRLNYYVSASTAQVRLTCVVVGAFAIIALAVTTIGVYGVISYSAARRRHEIGIRLALGARRSAIYKLVLGQGASLLAGSLAGGAVCTLAMSPLLHKFYRADEQLTLVLLTVGTVLTAVTFLASWLPARAAATLDPIVALGQR